MDYMRIKKVENERRENKDPDIPYCLIRAKSRYANLGRIFESDGCEDISAILPYLRNRLYNVSWESSAASPPGTGGTNSTLIRQLGKRYKSSSQGLPTTKFVRTRRHGENQGFMGFSLRYPAIRPSISLAVTPSG